MSSVGCVGGGEVPATPVIGNDVEAGEVIILSVGKGRVDEDETLLGRLEEPARELEPDSCGCSFG